MKFLRRITRVCTATRRANFLLALGMHFAAFRLDYYSRYGSESVDAAVLFRENYDFSSSVVNVSQLNKC